MVINNGLIINYGQGGTEFTYPCSFTTTWCCTAILIDNNANYSCRVQSNSTITIAYIHRGGSYNPFKIIAIGY